MRIVLKTKVKGNHRNIIKRFDRDLFMALAPKLAKINLKEFTGSEKGDKVHIEFLSPIKTNWISEIIDHAYEDNRSYFVDKGVVLPFPLRFWEHHHIIEQIDEDHVHIIDDIRFKSLNVIFTLFMYPAILVGFLPRKKIYKRYFNSKSENGIIRGLS